MAMRPGLETSVTHFDDDPLEFCVRAASGMLSGEARLHSHHSAPTPTELADEVRGFPANARDPRACEQGTFDPDYAGVGAKPSPSRVGPRGHALAHICLESSEESEKWGQVCLDVRVQPASIDKFVSHLARLGTKAAKAAELGGEASPSAAACGRLRSPRSLQRG